MAQRTSPIAVAHPKHIRQTVEVRLPESFDIPAESGRVENDAFSLAYSFKRRGNAVRLEYTLRSLNDHVPAERVTKYLEDLGRMQKAAGYQLSKGSSVFGLGPGPGIKPSHLLIGVLVLLAIPVAVLAAVVVWALERRRRAAFLLPEEPPAKSANA